MAVPLEVVLDRPGRTPLRITPDTNSLRWTTAIPGGFGSLALQLPGTADKWKRELGHLALVRLILDTETIWEGCLEDPTLDLAGTDPVAAFTAYGHARELDRTSIQRVWSKRDLDYAETIRISVGGISGGAVTRHTGLEVQAGKFDIADQTKTGIQISGTGVAIPTLNFNAADLLIPDAIAPVRLMFTTKIEGANAVAGKIEGFIHTHNDSNAAFIDSGGYTAAGPTAQNLALTSTVKLIRIGAYNAGALISPTAADHVQYYDLRLLCTALSEDATGGFYGGTILQDLIALVPGLAQGIIEQGSDFTIQQLERAVRQSARSVVDEVAAYYTREWAVWEDGIFNWKSYDLDNPDWILTSADLLEGSQITTTVDGLAETVYVLYTDAADGRAKESSAESTDQRNPFVKQGRPSDLLVDPGFPMTQASAAQLAARLASDQGGYPLVEGTLVVPAAKTIRRVHGSARPAFFIRAGENIVVSDLPKTEPLASGRDGETLFHIVGTEADLEQGTVTLEIEGQVRRADVLLARLGATTRTLTG